MSCRLGLAPTPPGGFNGGLIVAVEHIANPSITIECRGAGAIDQHQHVCPIGTLFCDGEIDRLARRVAVARAAVRQEAFVIVGPEQLIEMRDPLLRSGHHRDTISLLQRALQKPGQGPFERRRLQVVEADLGQLIQSS